jgi:hypothetical protein
VFSLGVWLWQEFCLSFVLHLLYIPTTCVSFRALPTAGRDDLANTATGSTRFHGHPSPASHSHFLRKDQQSPLLSNQQNVNSLDC